MSDTTILTEDYADESLILRWKLFFLASSAMKGLVSIIDSGYHIPSIPVIWAGQFEQA